MKSLFVFSFIFMLTVLCSAFDLPNFKEFPGNGWYIWEKTDKTLFDFATRDSAFPEVALKIVFKEGGADADCLFRNVSEYTPIWLKTEGISFWLKGDGSGNYGVLGSHSTEPVYQGKGFSRDGEYLVSFPLKDKTWKRMTFKWADFKSAKGENLTPAKVKMLFFALKEGAQRPADYIVDKFEVSKNLSAGPAAPETTAVLPDPPDPDLSKFVFQKAGLDSFKKLLAEKKPVTIVAFGDSVSAGASLWRNHEFPIDKYIFHSLLKEMLAKHYDNKNITIVNSGIGGEKAGDGLKRIDKDVLAHKPDLVIAEFGGNDGSIKMYQEATTKIVDILKQKNIPVLLVTPPKFIGSDDNKKEYVDFLKSFSKNRNIALAEYNGLFLVRGEEYMGELVSDEVHPNERGQLLIARLIFELFK